jgi:hypothetical protein
MHQYAISIQFFFDPKLLVVHQLRHFTGQSFPRLHWRQGTKVFHFLRNQEISRPDMTSPLSES